MSLFDQANVVTYTKTGAVAAANAMTVDVVPVAEVWQVLYCDVYHNDAANPQGCWYLGIGGVKIQLGAYAALNSGIRRYLYPSVTPDWPAPLTLHVGATLSYESPAGCTNGSVSTMSIVYKVIKGAL